MLVQLNAQNCNNSPVKNKKTIPLWSLSKTFNVVIVQNLQYGYCPKPSIWLLSKTFNMVIVQNLQYGHCPKPSIWLLSKPHIDLKLTNDFSVFYVLRTISYVE